MCDTTYKIDEWVTRGDMRVSLTDIGEGLCGDYDCDNPEDEPRLRIDVQVRTGHESAEDEAEPGWSWVYSDTSMCTDIHAETDGETLRGLIEHIANVLENDLPGSIKGALDGLSWLNATTLKPKAA